MSNELTTILKEQNVGKENATMLLQAFGAPFEQAGEVLSMHRNIVVKNEDDFASMAEAREKRLILKNVRVEVEKKRKELKEDSLRTGKAIDTVARFVKETIEPAEEYLQLQEDFSKIIAEQKKAELKAIRVETLLSYTDDIAPYNIDDMNDEQFNNLVATLKAQRELQMAEAKRVEDERIATQKAEAEAIEAQRQENERLKAEAEEREKKQAELNKLAQLEQDRLRAEADKNIAIERAKAEKLEQEKRDREEAEQRLKDMAEEAERQALLAPDKTKLVTFAQAIDTIRLTKLPAVKTKQAQDVVNVVELELSKLFNLIMDKAKQL